MEIVQEAFRIRAIPEMHDRLIVATARMMVAEGRSVALLTRDELIVRSGLVTTLW